MVAFSRRHFWRTDVSASTTHADHGEPRHVDPLRSISTANRSTSPFAGPAIDVPSTYDDGKLWVEVRAAASGLDIIDLRAKEVRSVPWDKLGTLVGALGTPVPELVDVAVAPDLMAQQLVDTLSALREVRWTNLAEAPAATASERLAQLRAARLAHRREDRVTVST